MTMPTVSNASRRAERSSAPDLLTLAEAAAVLRIGRIAIYELARRCEAAGGALDDLVVLRVGRQLRVPRACLEAKIGRPLTWPPVVEPPSDRLPARRSPSERSASPKPERASSARRPSPRPRRPAAESPSLFSV